MEKAFIYLQSNRSVFFKVEEQQIKDFLAGESDSYLYQRGIKIHYDCCEGHNAPLYTAFSRSSPLYEEQPNPFFDNSKLISAENFPTMLVPGSVPDKLKNALQNMIDSGEVEELISKYKIN